MTNKRIKVLVVSYSLSGGGAEKFASTLISHLDRDKFKLSLSLFRDEISFPLPDDVTLTLLDMKKPLHIGRTIYRLRRLIRQFRPHVIISTFEFVSRFLGIALALGGSDINCRWIARISNKPDIYNDRYTFIASQWSKLAYLYADEFITNSRSLSRDFENYYPFAGGRVHFIYNPIDFELIDRLSQEPPAVRIDTGKPVIVSIGRLERQKRYDVLLDSFAHLRNRIPSILLICGEGKLRDHITQDIKARELVDSVQLLGFQRNPYPLLRRASLFVLTSDHEGLPNVLIEAQGLGIPAVSTNCPYGPSEIIEDGKTGILTGVGDSKGIAGAMEELLTDLDRNKAMGKTARTRARRLFDKSKLIASWEELLSENLNI